MTTQQPEALRLAELLELAPEDGIEPQTAEDAAAELRRLHAENVRQPRPEQSTCGDSEMANKQHPAQFDWATELLDAEGHVTLSKQEAKEIGARLRSMGEKLKAYEDLDEAASDVQLLRMGYAAARLEIESLKAQLHAAKQINAAQFTLLAASIPGSVPPQGKGWVVLPGQLPEPGKPVLLDIGKECPIRAMWAAKHTLPVGMEDDSCVGEYDEATDTYYCPEGWYEWNELEETHWRVTGNAVAWRELPPSSAKGA